MENIIKCRSFAYLSFVCE